MRKRKSKNEECGEERGDIRKGKLKKGIGDEKREKRKKQENGRET